MAEDLSLPVLARAWQMLLRGTEEVRAAPDGAAAAEMLLLRLACVAELPPPAELARLIRGDGAPPAHAAASAAPATPPPRERVAVAAVPVPGPAAPTPAVITPAPPVAAAPAPSPPPPATEAPPPGLPQSYRELVERIRAEGGTGGMLAALLEGQTRLIRFEPGRVELRLDPIAPPTLPNQLSEAAKRLTGQRWVVMVGSGEGEATLAEQAEARRRQRIEELRHDPTFRPLLDTFPGAEIVDVREIAPAAARAAEPTLPRGIREA